MADRKYRAAAFWIRFVDLLDHVLGLVRPLEPWLWPSYVRRLATADAWMPPMMMIAAAMLVGFASRGFGLLGAHPVVKVINYAALATWFVVAGFASILVILQSSRNLKRLGFVACSRPRWWFELSRICWIAFVFLALAIALAFFGKLANAALASRFLVPAVSAFLAGFLLFSSTGYAVSFVGRRPRRGRAFECVQYFYLLWMGGFVVFIPLLLAQRLGGADGARLVAPAIAIAAVLCAGILARNA